MILSDASDPGSPLRKSFIHSTNNNNNLASINQQLNNLGSINHQLNTLSQQLSGLNQQSQNLQNIQTLGNNFNNVMPNMNNNIISQDLLQQQDLFQSNQELLNRLQALNLGFNSSINNYSPKNSFMYTNNQLSPNNNINMNLLSSPSSVGNLTPSPILNRSSYSSSPLFEDSLGVSMERNLDRMSNDSQFIRPLSQVGTMTTMDNDGKVKVVVPVSGGEHSKVENQVKKTDKHVTLPDFVTLRVTDETGNVTNTRKISATPSFITRSTSEKVPNRSQIMSEVQRTAWARHTTK